MTVHHGDEVPYFYSEGKVVLESLLVAPVIILDLAASDRQSICTRLFLIEIRRIMSKF